MFRRMIFGLLFILPILLTILVVWQIYLILNYWVITPVAWLILPDAEVAKAVDAEVAKAVAAEAVAKAVAAQPVAEAAQGEVEGVWPAIKHYVTPPITLLAVMMLLYFLGYAFQTRLSSVIDWVFDHIPGVSVVYRAIRDASLAVQGPDGIKTINTVVLVPFPHPGARATGFLMGESEDKATGKPLVCVYIPLALFPPSGYTLVFPRADVTITRWEATAPWKLLLSGGLTVPKMIPFEPITSEAESERVDAK